MLRVDFGPPNELRYILSTDGNILRCAVRDLAGNLAAELPNFALQLANTGLARVARDDFRQRVIPQGQLPADQSVFSQLTRHEIAPGNLELLPFRVARKIHGLEPVEERRGNVLDEVRGGDEQHLRQIERYAEIMVRERVVLRRIEHLEQRCRGIALERDAQLVDLIEQEDRILGARLLHALNDPAGHGAHIRPAMPTDVGLVARSTEGNADVGP